MKIIINENESYQINFPEEVSGEEFLGIKSRLDSIEKLLNKNLFFQTPKQSQPIKTKKKKEKKEYFLNRDLAIKLIAKYYKSTALQKKELLEGCGSSVDIFKNDRKRLIDFWKIQPNEINLKEFVTAGNPPQFLTNETTTKTDTTT